MKTIMSLIMHIIFILLLLFLLPCCAFGSNQELPDLALLAIEKSHSEVITKFPHSWKINVNSETPIENQSITIEVLEGISKNPNLKSSSNIDFSSLKAIVDDVISPEMTDEEKALSLWRFVMDNTYHGPWGTSSDGLEHLNVYGYGYCGTFAAVLEPLWWAAGLKARHVNIGNHAATEVFYDNDWHYIDAHRRYFFLEKDNNTIASLDDLNDLPELWDMKRQKKQTQQKGENKYYYMTMHPKGHGNSPEYSSNFTFANGDKIFLTWQKNGKWCLERGAEGRGKPAPEPAIYANGSFRFQRDLSNPVQSREGLVSSRNIDWNDFTAGYLHPQKITEEAYIIYEVRVPYFIPSTTISGKFLRKTHADFIALDISTDNGQTWVTLWGAVETGQVKAELLTDKTQEVTTDKPWKYSYLLRIRVRAGKDVQDTGIYSIESDNDLFYNPRSLPGLQKSENKLTFHDEGTSPHTVKVTYTWREKLPVRISRELPLDKEEVTIVCRINNMGRAEAKDVKIVLYEGNPQKDGVVIGEDVIKRIPAGKVGTAQVKWRPTRWDSKSKERTDGIEIFAVVDPEDLIKESNKDNNSFSRTIKVLNPPQIDIPSESFVKFEKKKGDLTVLTITATVRNFSSSPQYGYYLNDHATAEKIVVKFFDGEPNEGKQIGTEQVIESLKPLEFKNVSVDWDISRLDGQHKIYVQVLPPENVRQALGTQKPKEISTTVDLDKYRKCIAKSE